MENLKQIALESNVIQDEKPGMLENCVLRKLIPVIFSIIAAVSSCVNKFAADAVKADSHLIEEEFLSGTNNSARQSDLNKIKMYYLRKEHYSDKEISAMESAMIEILKARGKNEDFISGFIEAVRDQRMINLLLNPPTK
ncbi:hypothetical protein HZA39_01880 [Candidatus Peregrinibacteria bacterium]|nr:hypothetical protein [Candidatus Peregrinibacteria bacterium]